MKKITSLLLLVSPIGFIHAKAPQVKPLKTGWYYIADKPTPFKRQLEKTQTSYFINPVAIVTAKQIAKVGIADDDIRHAKYVAIKFNDAATNAFSIATAKSIHQKIALIIDDKLIIAPTVQAQITSGVSAINRGDYSKEELERFVTIIKTEMK